MLHSAPIRQLIAIADRVGLFGFSGIFGFSVTPPTHYKKVQADYSACTLYIGLSLLLQQTVGLLVGEYNLGLEGLCLLEIHKAVAHDDYDVANGSLASSCAIEADAATTALTLDYIGLDALAIVVVHNLYLLALDKTCGIHQILVDGDATYIVQIRLSNTHTVNLRFHSFDKHSLGRLALLNLDVVDKSYLASLHSTAALDTLRLLPALNLLHGGCVNSLKVDGL